MLITFVRLSNNFKGLQRVSSRVKIKREGSLPLYYMLSVLWISLALTPDPFSYVERGPGTHCLHIHQNCIRETVKLLAASTLLTTTYIVIKQRLLKYLPEEALHSLWKKYESSK